jgi:hypothetical protein
VVPEASATSQRTTAPPPVAAPTRPSARRASERSTARTSGRRGTAQRRRERRAAATARREAHRGAIAHARRVSPDPVASAAAGRSAVERRAVNAADVARRDDADRSRRLALAGAALLVLSLASLGLLAFARAGGWLRAWG